MDKNLGVIYLTNYRIIFIPYNRSSYVYNNYRIFFYLTLE